MDSEQNNFIEIRRVISDSNRINISSQPEVIRISLIETFRAWYKGVNDKLIEGPMTVLVLKDNRKIEERVGPPRTMLIEEHYDDFTYRMSLRASVKRLSDGPSNSFSGEQGA